MKCNKPNCDGVVEIGVCTKCGAESGPSAASEKSNSDNRAKNSNVKEQDASKSKSSADVQLKKTAFAEDKKVPAAPKAQPASRVGDEDTPSPAKDKSQASRSEKKDGKEIERGETVRDRKARERKDAERKEAGHREAGAKGKESESKKATEHEASEQKAAENKTTEQKATEHRATEHKSSEHKSSERKESEPRAPEPQTPDHQAVDGGELEHKASETREPERKKSEHKASEHKVPDSKESQQEKLEKPSAQKEPEKQSAHKETQKAEHTAPIGARENKPDPRKDEAAAKATSEPKQDSSPSDVKPESTELAGLVAKRSPTQERKKIESTIPNRVVAVPVEEKLNFKDMNLEDTAAYRNIIETVRSMLEPREVAPSREDLYLASRALRHVMPYNFDAWRLHADLLLTAIHQLETRQLQPDPNFTLMAIPLREDDLRDAAEQALRECAHFADNDKLKIKLIDEANSVRRLTWF